jgi:hypothetical protein
MTERRTHAGAPLTACMRHYLMAGWPDATRLPGWLDCLLVEPDALEQLWRLHRRELIAEAKAGRFAPAGLLWFERQEPCGNVPPDAERAAWSSRFCAEWGY